MEEIQYTEGVEKGWIFSSLEIMHKVVAKRNAKQQRASRATEMPFHCSL